MKRWTTILCNLLGMLLLTALWPGIAGAGETVCLRCHGGQAGRLGEPVPQWQGSVHRAGGISCHHCHGGNPADFALAMNPDQGFIGVPTKANIPSFCGRCHVGVLEDYLASAHGRALNHDGPQCVTCHGNHRVVRASLDLINPRDCSRCHAYGRAEELRQAVAGTDTLIAGLTQNLAELHRLGFATKAQDEALFALRNDFHRVFHDVDVEKVRAQTAVFEQRLGKIATAAAAIRQRHEQRKLWGGIIVAVLVLAGLCALLIHKSYREEKSDLS